MRRPRRSLSIVTAPTLEPVTLTEAKAWARIDTTDDDTVVTGLITAARMAGEEYLRRTLISTSYKLTIDLTASLGGYLGEGTYDLPVTAPASQPTRNNGTKAGMHPRVRFGMAFTV